MNFRGQRDFTHNKKQYQKVVAYLVGIQFNYPDFYLVLSQAPQFEYEVDGCRKKIRYARRYLSRLENLVLEYQHENKIDVIELNPQVERVSQRFLDGELWDI